MLLFLGYAIDRHVRSNTTYGLGNDGILVLHFVSLVKNNNTPIYSRGKCSSHFWNDNVFVRCDDDIETLQITQHMLSKSLTLVLVLGVKTHDTK